MRERDISIDVHKKTICATSKDIINCCSACCDEGNSITKEFYDWYLKDGHFFMKKGVLAVRSENNKDDYLYVEFDLTDPEDAVFILLDANNWKNKCCKFHFYREENLTMKDIHIKMEFTRLDVFRRQKYMLTSLEDRTAYFNRRANKAGEDFKRKAKHDKRHASKSKRRLVKDVMVEEFRELFHPTCTMLVYGLYAIMYNFSKSKKEFVTSEGLDENPSLNEYVLAKYKYSGFVDLSKHTTVYVNTKDDPDHPRKKYERHIGSWSVRGHYRRINGSLVWIRPHTRGQGELEERTYGTGRELISQAKEKVFYVLRRKKAFIRSEPEDQGASTIWQFFINLFKRSSA